MYLALLPFMVASIKAPHLHGDNFQACEHNFQACEHRQKLTRTGT